VHFIISGHLTLSGEGYEGATVTLTDDLNGDRLVDATITDEQGEFAFTGLPNGTYTVTVLVVGQNVAPVSIPGIVIARDDSFGHDFTLVTYTVSGRVTSGEAGYPGVLVTLYSGAVASTLSTITMASGDYAFPGLLNGYSGTVTPSSPGDTFNPVYRLVKINNYQDETDQDFVVVLPNTYAISGTVDLKDAENDWVTLNLTSGAAAIDSTTPDSSGHYSFANLPSGAYTVTPSSEYGTFDEEPQSAAITDSDIPDVNFTFNPYTYTISGTVTLNDADPGGITITLTEEGTTVATATPGESGAYSFPGRLPGTYTVTPTGDGVFSPRSAPVTIEASDVTGVNFTFTPDTYFITGTVTPEEGELDGITLTLTSGATLVDTTTPNASGAFFFAGLLPGTYTVTPSGDGVFSPTSAPVTIEASDVTGVNFTFTPDTYSINGTVLEGTDGKEDVTLALSGDGSGSVVTEESGAYSFTDLLPGDYTVAPSSSDPGEFVPEFWNVTITDTDFPAADFTFNPDP